MGCFALKNHPTEFNPRAACQCRILGLKLDELFYHRVSRKVRRDGTVAWGGNRFEVDYGANCKTRERRPASPRWPISELEFLSMEPPCK